MRDCHDPKRAFSDGRPVPIGIAGAKGTRNSPALINRGYGSVFFWDGRAPSLERQVLEPVLNPKELGLNEAELERRTGLKRDEAVAALASYVRTILSGNSRFDRYSAGQSRALNVLERRVWSCFVAGAVVQAPSPASLTSVSTIRALPGKRAIRRRRSPNRFRQRPRSRRLQDSNAARNLPNCTIHARRQHGHPGGSFGLLFRWWTNQRSP